MSDIYDNIEFTYDSQKRKHPAIEELMDAIKYRDMIFQFVRRDIVSRYKRSVLGVLWTMLQPLGMMIVMTIVFSQLFHQLDGYASYILSGLISWTFFAQTTTAVMSDMSNGRSLSGQIYIPHTAFAISSLLTGMVNITISIFPLILISFIIGKPITWAFLFLPVATLIISAFSLGIGLIFSTFAVHFPDFKEIYQIILQAWMYFTPIIYPESILPESISAWVLYSNPMFYMVRLFRDPVYNGSIPSLAILCISISVAAATMIFGWAYFSKQSDTFAYKA